jgi:hypothetical protein
MNLIKTKDIGLSAYILMNSNNKFVSYEKSRKEFTLECEETLECINANYINSESRKHDSLVIYLKHLMYEWCY